jgi:hypothetical protein
MTIAHVPIVAKPNTRPSRLFSRIPTYLKHSTTTLVRMYALYEPLKVFFGLGTICIGFGVIIGLRFVLDYVSGDTGGHVQSLILASVLLIVGFVTMLHGLLADLIGNNRSLLEDTRCRVRELELRLGNGPDVVRLVEDIPISTPQRLEKRGSR